METSLGRKKSIESTFHLAANKQAGPKIDVNTLLLSRIQHELTARQTFWAQAYPVYPTRIDCAEHTCFCGCLSHVKSCFHSDLWPPGLSPNVPQTLVPKLTQSKGDAKTATVA